MRGLCCRCPFSGAHLGIPAQILLAARANDASDAEAGGQGREGDTNGPGDLPRGFLPFDVTPDKIVHIERVDFSGHVYNLQTDSEWYVANGIIAHNCRYAATGSLYYSAHSWNAPATVKMWKSIEIQADNLGRMQYLTVNYRVDGGAWVELGDAKVSPSTSLGITPSGVAGEEIEIRLDFVQLSEQTPIIVRGVIARGIERPSTTDIISAVVRCADKLPLRTAGYCPRTGATILSELKALAYYPTSVTLVDPVGSERQVVVIPPVTEQAEYAQTGEMSRELLINLQMAVVDFEESRFTEVTIFGGGSGHALLVPIIVPITLGGEAVDASVTFTSTKTSRPRITLIGSFGDDLVITDNEGRVLDFTGTAIGPTKIITIDMHTSTPTVLDEAGDDWESYLVSSNLASFAIVAGSNTITATCSGGAVAASKIYLEY